MTAVGALTRHDCLHFPCFRSTICHQRDKSARLIERFYWIIRQLHIIGFQEIMTTAEFQIKYFRKRGRFDTIRIGWA